MSTTPPAIPELPNWVHPFIVLEGRDYETERMRARADRDWLLKHRDWLLACLEQFNIPPPPFLNDADAIRQMSRMLDKAVIHLALDRRRKILHSVVFALSHVDLWIAAKSQDQAYDALRGFGESMTSLLSRIHHLKSASKGGRGKRTRVETLKQITADMVRASPALSAEEIFEAIPESHESTADCSDEDLELYRDGDRIFVIQDGIEIANMAFSSWEKRYVRPARADAGH